MTTYTVTHHKGRSGKSVYEWRVYAEYSNGSRHQLAKYRTKDFAEHAAETYRANAERIAKKQAEMG